MQRNPYRPLKGPSFFSVLRFRRLCFFRFTKVAVGFGSNFAARMASRRPNLPRKREKRDPQNFFTVSEIFAVLQ